MTEFPGLEPADEGADLPGFGAAAPAPGVVTQVAGPFDDRFRLDRLVVDQGVVSGRIRVTSDVSELLDLEVVAGFYDDEGHFLGTGRFVHHLDGSTGLGHEALPSETETFRIPAPQKFASDVSAAVVGVTVLVNE